MPPPTLTQKIKVHLKLAISRLRIVQQKDTALAKKQRREMATLLEAGKYESARIRVENIIRSDLTTELLEILELYCELLLARIGLMEPRECDPGLEEAVKSIIYAAPRTEIKELGTCRVLLVEKYGKEFMQSAMENRDGKVPDRVLRKLRVEPPGGELVESYLKAIANAYDVRYGEEEEDVKEEADVEEKKDAGDDGDDEPGTGGQAQKIPEEPLSTEELTKATPPRDLGPRSPVSIAPPSPSTDNANPKVKLPGAPLLKPNAKMKKPAETPTKAPATNGNVTKSKVDGDVPDVNDLEARFKMLKR